MRTQTGTHMERRNSFSGDQEQDDIFCSTLSRFGVLEQDSSFIERDSQTFVHPHPWPFVTTCQLLNLPSARHPQLKREEKVETSDEQHATLFFHGTPHVTAIPEFTYAKLSH